MGTHARNFRSLVLCYDEILLICKQSQFNESGEKSIMGELLESIDLTTQNNCFVEAGIPFMVKL